MVVQDSSAESKKFFRNFVATASREQFIEALSFDWFNEIIPGAKNLIGCGQGGKFMHLEGDAAEHTGFVYENFKKCAEKHFGRSATFIESLAVILHDIRKPETRVEKAPGEVSFPGHEKRAADEVVPVVAQHLGLTETERDELDFLVRYHGDANAWPKTDPEIKNKILRSPSLQSLALLQEADALSCIMSDGGCAPVYWDALNPSPY